MANNFFQETWNRWNIWSHLERFGINVETQCLRLCCNFGLRNYPGSSAVPASKAHYRFVAGVLLEHGYLRIVCVITARYLRSFKGGRYLAVIRRIKGRYRCSCTAGAGKLQGKCDAPSILLNKLCNANIT